MIKRVQYDLNTNRLNKAQLREWIQALDAEQVPDDVPIVFNSSECTMSVHVTRTMDERGEVRAT